jgi:hypothetical protein
VRINTENGLPLRVGEGATITKETVSSTVSPSARNGAATLSAALPIAGAVSGISKSVHLAAQETAAENGGPLIASPSVDTVSGPSQPMSPNPQSNLSPASEPVPQTPTINGSIPGVPDRTPTATAANAHPNSVDGQPPSTASLAPPPRSDGSAPLPGFYNTPPANPQMMPSQTTPFAIAPIPVPELPPVIEHSTRNCLILENFNELSVKSKDIQCQILFGRKFPKASSRFIPSLVFYPRSTPIPCQVTNYVQNHPPPTPAP